LANVKVKGAAAGVAVAAFKESLVSFSSSAFFIINDVC
jgi:hypothetical protein